MKRVLIAGAIVLALAGCSRQSTPASITTPAPVTTPTTAPAATADPLAGLDSSLSTADGAVNQSQSDLSTGDASAAKNDDQ